jgi:hypothetical protein
MGASAGQIRKNGFTPSRATLVFLCSSGAALALAAWRRRSGGTWQPEHGRTFRRFMASAVKLAFRDSFNSDDKPRQLWLGLPFLLLMVNMRVHVGWTWRHDVLRITKY